MRKEHAARLLLQNGHRVAIVFFLPLLLLASEAWQALEWLLTRLVLSSLPSRELLLSGSHRIINDWFARLSLLKVGQSHLISVSNEFSIEITEIIRFFHNKFKAIPAFVSLHSANVDRSRAVRARSPGRLNLVVKQVGNILLIQIRVLARDPDLIVGVLLCIFHFGFDVVENSKRINILSNNREFNEVPGTTEPRRNFGTRKTRVALGSFIDLVLDLLHHVL